MTFESNICILPSVIIRIYFPGLNSSLFGTWERGREGVNLIPVRPPAFSSLTSVSGAAVIPTIWLDMYLAAAK